MGLVAKTFVFVRVSTREGLHAGCSVDFVQPERVEGPNRKPEARSQNVVFGRVSTRGMVETAAQDVHRAIAATRFEGPYLTSGRRSSVSACSSVSPFAGAMQSPGEAAAGVNVRTGSYQRPD
jgi:hypothetical protein